MNTKEHWRPIPGFPDYEVSNLGRIRSFRRKTAKMLSNYPGMDGRAAVFIYNDSNRLMRCRIARLVLLSFVGPCPDGMETCHNNGDSTDDRLCNLRYDTHAANMQDAVSHKVMPRGERSKTALFSNAEVCELRELFSAGTWGTVAEFAAEFGFLLTTACNMLAGKTYRDAGGPLHISWRMVEDNVVECRTLRANGWPLSDLAAKYGKDKSTISRVCRGKVHKHVGGPIVKAWERMQPRKAS